MARYTDKFRNKVRTAIAEGMSQAEAAKRFHVTTTTIRAWKTPSVGRTTATGTTVRKPKALAQAPIQRPDLRIVADAITTLKHAGLI